MELKPFFATSSIETPDDEQKKGVSRKTVYVCVAVTLVLTLVALAVAIPLIVTSSSSSSSHSPPPSPSPLMSTGSSQEATILRLYILSEGGQSVYCFHWNDTVTEDSEDPDESSCTPRYNFNFQATPLDDPPPFPTKAEWIFPSAHPMRLSTTPDGTHGGGEEFSSPEFPITTSTIDNTDLSSLTISFSHNASSYPSYPTTLYYYCKTHSGMGGMVQIWWCQNC